MWLRAERDLASMLAMVEGGGGGRGRRGKGDGEGSHAQDEDANDANGDVE